MNKTTIKNFAVWARNKLIADISYRAGLMGITESGIASALPQSTGTTEFYDIGTAEPYAISGDAVRQRRRLVDLIERKEKETDYKTAYKYIIEEVAYTWFNRLIAIRFMEVNDYLPSHIRVLSSESGKIEPDLVANPFDAELVFSKEEEQKIITLKQENQADELFRMLFIKQCNVLSEIFPMLFEKEHDYSELLMNFSIIDQEGILYHLVNDIPEEDFDVEQGGQVEIIGWLYQYYNTEPKDEAFALLKKNIKVSKERIPAVTQLFTPDWIVQYMVENSLGRLWIDAHPETELKNGWKYYLHDIREERQNCCTSLNVNYSGTRIEPEKIKIIDPCMGSGHILVKAFDMLIEIYESVGYSKRDAAKSILENNIFGLDIDDRAYQIAYFAIMMKARNYNRRIFNENLNCNIYSIKESNTIDRKHLNYFGGNLDDKSRKEAVRQINLLLDIFVDAKEYGSILAVSDFDWDLLKKFVQDSKVVEQYSFETVGIDETQQLLKELVKIGKIMAQKYHVVVTNPPYMGNSGFNNKLSNYVKKYFPDSKSDLFSVFIEKCCDYADLQGYYAMITQPSFLFLSSFEKLRKKITNNNTIINLLHMGRGIFGIDFGSSAFVIKKGKIGNYIGQYFRLHERTFQYIDPDDICKLFLYAKSEEDPRYDFSVYDAQQGINWNDCDSDKSMKLKYRYIQSDFDKIPGTPIAYWASPKIMNCFENEKIEKRVLFRQGMATSDNNRFLRLWYEVEQHKSNYYATDLEDALESKKKWFAYNKGGAYRKWYGNIEYVVNWENDGSEMKAFTATLPQGMNVRLKSREYYFKECYSWSKISSSQISFRYYPSGFAFDVAGCCVFNCGNHLDYYLALSNSVITSTFASFLSPTLNYELDHLKKIPVIMDASKEERISELVRENIKLSKEDWDSFETSWDFECHPLVGKSDRIEDAYNIWEQECEERYLKVKHNEEELNRIFINIYQLEDELSPNIDEDGITINKADRQRDVKGLLSYAVGCMLGRYSLNEKGLIYAGGEWTQNKYGFYKPDIDNIIPITDEEYLEDDIVARFCDWVKMAYSEESLEDNLDYIAQILGGKGNSSRDVIRNYFLNEFIDDHIKMYQKRPIYWQFESGKQNGIKTIVYMHRYNADTIGNIRIDYLHRIQRVYENEISRMQDMIDHSSNAREIAVANKRKEKLQKQLKECRQYDEKIGHLALARIELDMDDGVKVNYEKVQRGIDGKKYQVLTKI